MPTPPPVTVNEIYGQAINDILGACVSRTLPDWREIKKRVEAAILTFTERDRLVISQFAKECGESLIRVNEELAKQGVRSNDTISVSIDRIPVMNAIDMNAYCNYIKYCGRIQAALQLLKEDGIIP